VGNLTQEQVPTETKDTTHSPRPQVDNTKQYGNTIDIVKLEILIDTTISIIEENKQETIPLGETSRGTLEELNYTTP